MRIKSFLASRLRVSHETGLKQLYKYRPIFNQEKSQIISIDERARFLLDILIRNKLYFSNPLELNDPHELRPSFSLGNIRNIFYRKKFIDYVYEIISNDYPHLTKEQFAAAISEHKDLVSQRFGQRYTARFRQHFSTGQRICSFSATPSNPLLWSHYADSHRGVCLIFEANNH